MLQSEFYRNPDTLDFKELGKAAFIEQLQNITGLFSKWDIEKFLIQNDSDHYNKFQAIEAIGSILANLKVPSAVKCELDRTEFKTVYPAVLKQWGWQRTLEQAIEKAIACPTCGRRYFYFISKNSWYSDRKLTILL